MPIEPFEGVADVDEVGQLGETQVDLPLVQAVEPALESKQLDAGLLGVERGVLQGDADAQPHRFGVVGDVVAGDDGSAAGGGDQGAEHPDHRGLAGAVGAQEAVDLAGLDVEVDAGDGLGLAEATPQVLGGDGGAHGSCRHGAAACAGWAAKSAGWCCGVHGRTFQQGH